MARTVSAIYDALIAEKQNMATLNGLQPAMDDEQTLLNDLNSNSKVADWRLFTYIIAFGHWLHETLWDLFRIETEEIIAKFRPGTLRWYQEQAFAFQFGDELDWDAVERKYKYPAIDASKMIVKLCSVTEPGGVVRIKVATLNGNTIVKIPANQLSALQAYYNKIKYPGKLLCVSFDADLLKILGTIKYDPLADPVVVKAAVEAAINSYLTGLEFNGRFNITLLIDKIQSVPGVVDFTGITISTKYGSLPYQAVVDEYQTNAGYAQVDPAFPLANTLTYLPYV